MNQRWQCTLRVTQSQTKLLLTDPSGDLLKARMDITPCHPRALLTLLEGLSLWSGQLLCVALSVDDSCRQWPVSLLGDELWPSETQLVRFDIVPPARRRRAKLAGVGDFRQLRLIDREKP